MAAVQVEDVHVSFLFVCDLNGNHQEWLHSMIAIFMELRPCTSRLFLLATTWLLARTMHVQEPKRKQLL